MDQRSKFFMITLMLLGLATLMGIALQANEARAADEAQIAIFALGDLDRLECMQRTLARMNMVSPIEYPPSMPHCPGQTCLDLESRCEDATNYKPSLVGSTQAIASAMLTDQNPCAFCNVDFEPQVTPRNCCPGCPRWPWVHDGSGATYAELIASMEGTGDVRFRCRYDKNALFCFAFRCEEADPAGCKQMWRLERKVSCCTNDTAEGCMGTYGYACNGTTRCFDVGENDGVCEGVNTNSTTECPGFPQ